MVKAGDAMSYYQNTVYYGGGYAHSYQAYGGQQSMGDQTAQPGSEVIGTFQHGTGAFVPYTDPNASGIFAPGQPGNIYGQQMQSQLAQQFPQKPSSTALIAIAGLAVVVMLARKK